MLRERVVHVLPTVEGVGDIRLHILSFFLFLNSLFFILFSLIVVFIYFLSYLLIYFSKT